MVVMTVEGMTSVFVVDNAEELFTLYNTLCRGRKCTIDGVELKAIEETSNNEYFGGYTRGFFNKFFN